MLTKGQKHGERTLLGAAKACYFAAALSAAAFAYGFLVFAPQARNAYSRSLEVDQFTFVTGGRWYFFAAAIAFVVMALISVRKANRLH